MTAIWHRPTTTWHPLSPAGFPDESALHGLIEEAPHLLPLAGKPTLVILGREVQLGTGYADLLAVEPDGRPAILEIKLARNAEARRAVVSQVLAYAAFLHGTSLDDLQSTTLRKHLKPHASIADAVAACDQEGSFDRADFEASLARNLAEGRFRLVIVLDSAPAELVRLVGYLEMVSDKLLIDLVTVTSYDVAGTQILVPQRIEPARSVAAASAAAPAKTKAAKGHETDGAEVFAESIAQAAPEKRKPLEQLVAWAKGLESDGLATLSSFTGVSTRWALLPRFQPDNVGLVTLWNENGAAISLWRSVFERRAPAVIAAIEAKTGVPIGQGNTVRAFDEELLGLFTEAYRLAANKPAAAVVAGNGRSTGAVGGA